MMVSQKEKKQAVVQGDDCTFCMLPFEQRDKIVKSCVQAVSRMNPDQIDELTTQFKND